MSPEIEREIEERMSEDLDDYDLASFARRIIPELVSELKTIRIHLDTERKQYCIVMRQVNEELDHLRRCYDEKVKELESLKETLNGS